MITSGLMDTGMGEKSENADCLSRIRKSSRWIIRNRQLAFSIVVS